MILLSLLACTGADDPLPCTPAIVTDIDETLTTSNAEYLLQLVDPSHDPAMRPDANTLMQSYADLGHAIVYVTARGQDVTLGDGRTARQATLDWLVDYDFPVVDAHVFLAEGLGVGGEDTVTYKASVMTQLSDDGLSFAWGYGNADTDIEGFRLGGLDDDHLFLVGTLAGTMGVHGIVDEDAYTAHLSHLDRIDPDRCE